MKDRPSSRVMQVIETVFNRGQGTSDDPVREVTVYRSLDGELLAERDPMPPRGQGHLLREFANVERLARAWANVMDGRRIGTGPDAPRIDGDTVTSDDWRAIVEEYATLAADDDDAARSAMARL